MISDAAHRELRLACETAAPSSRAFEGCTRCLDTGWAFVPHSDEMREPCDCAAAEMKREGAQYGAFLGASVS